MTDDLEARVKGALSDAREREARANLWDSLRALTDTARDVLVMLADQLREDREHARAQREKVQQQREAMRQRRQ